MPLDELATVARGRVRRAVVFGEAADLFRAAFETAGVEALATPGVEAAVVTAFDRMDEDEALHGAILVWLRSAALSAWRRGIDCYKEGDMLRSG